MHYYQFNIGDYTSHTRGLSHLEDLAYRRIIDEYYLSEQPLNGCSTEVARMIGMREFSDEVGYVLDTFFEQIDGKWVHERIESEISAYKDKLEKVSRAGKASALARKKNKRSTHVEQTNNECATNHKPITINQDKDKARPKDANQVTEYARSIGFILDGQKFIDHYEANGWMRGKNKIKDWKACVRTWKGNQVGEQKPQPEDFDHWRRVGEKLDPPMRPHSTEEHRDYIMRVKAASGVLL